MLVVSYVTLNSNLFILALSFVCYFSLHFYVRGTGRLALVVNHYRYALSVFIVPLDPISAASGWVYLSV